jgi:hypothetical protein
VLLSLVALCLIGGAQAAPIVVLFETVTTTADSGAGSLRAAINNANGSQPNPTQIDFNIPGDGPHVIQPLTPLPEIAASVFILGNTQPGFVETPLIEIDGSLAGAQADGLNIDGDNSVVRSLAVHSWSANGIFLDDARDVTVRDCHIGVDSMGTQARPNQRGVLIFQSGCVIGPGNLISGNAGAGSDRVGVDISGGGGNMIMGNRIGTDVTGTAAISNDIGISIFSSAQNVIGGSTSPERNVISGNIIGVALDGFATQSTEILGNFIGTDVTGAFAVSNEFGLRIESPMTLLGGSGAGEGNLISGNSLSGVRFTGEGESLVQGNVIGLAADGVTPIPNGTGVELLNSASNVVGGASPEARNVISGNLMHGILISGGLSAENQVFGNFIGTDAMGLVDAGNLQSGIFIDHASSNAIGGVQPGTGNILSGNSRAGITIAGSGSSSTGVRGNLIGLDISGTAAIPNAQGIEIFDNANMSVIGGNATGEGNVISGNLADGIILYEGAVDTEIKGNLIGTSASGTLPIGNGCDGIRLLGSQNIIGNTFPGGANVIAFNGENGIEIDSDRNLVEGNRIFANALTGIGVLGGQRNRLLENVSYSNGALGIDLGQDGPTVNPTFTTNTQANDAQVYPEITRVLLTDTVFAIDVMITDVPSAEFRIDIFGNDACDPSGFGEGTRFIFDLTVMTDATGVGVGGIETLLDDFEVGRFITATATGPDGSTSEFSPCFDTEAGPPAAGDIVSYILGITFDPTGLNLNSDGAIDSADLVTHVNASPEMK